MNHIMNHLLDREEQCIIEILDDSELNYNLRRSDSDTGICTLYLDVWVKKGIDPVDLRMARKRISAMTMFREVSYGVNGNKSKSNNLFQIILCRSIEE